MMMNKYGYSIALLFAVLFLNCNRANYPNSALEQSDTVISTSYQNTKDILSDYQLVWQDEFDGNDLDLLKWNYRADGTTRKLGIVDRGNIVLDGKGHLSIKVTKDNEGSYHIGQIGTGGLFSTTYGYFECRAKMNKQLGPHVAFWLQSPTLGTILDDPAKDGAEIDIFEYHRKAPHTVYHNIHWGGYGEGHQHVGDQVELDDVGEGFHTFGLLWTKDEYVFYVDGKKTWQTTEAISQREEYIILSAELTGWGGDPDEASYPDSVVYDYVRVYKPKNK